MQNGNQRENFEKFSILCSKIIIFWGKNLWKINFFHHFLRLTCNHAQSCRRVKKGKRGWKLLVNVRIHVHFYAGFDDVFWSCNAGFCSPTPSVSSPPILPPLAEQRSSLHGQNTFFSKDHSYKSFQTLCRKSFVSYIWTYNILLERGVIVLAEDWFIVTSDRI